VKVPDKFWDNKENHKKYLIWLAQELGIKSTEDWYKVTSKDFTERGGAGLLYLHYNGSAIQALEANFPEAKFEVWKFRHAPKGFFNVEDNAKSFLMSVSNQLGITRLDEWYSIFINSINAYSKLHLTQALQSLERRCITKEKRWACAIAS
jgi:hypothetical protein